MSYTAMPTNIFGPLWDGINYIQIKLNTIDEDENIPENDNDQLDATGVNPNNPPDL